MNCVPTCLTTRSAVSHMPYKILAKHKYSMIHKPKLFDIQRSIMYKYNFFTDTCSKYETCKSEL